MATRSATCARASHASSAARVVTVSACSSPAGGASSTMPSRVKWPMPPGSASSPAVPSPAAPRPARPPAAPADTCPDVPCPAEAPSPAAAPAAPATWPVPASRRCRSATSRRAKVRSSQRSNSPSSASSSSGRSLSVSTPPTQALRSASRSTVTSSRPRGSQSRAARRFSPTLPLISSACCRMASSEPYSFSHLAAVLGPTLSTPGTLSTASPVSVRKSMICPGSTPNLSRTPAASITVGGTPSRVIVLTSSVSSSTSCARSLSPVEMTVRMPAARARVASVPITSSASMPGTTSSGQPSAWVSSWMGAICATSASGVWLRLAL